MRVITMTVALCCALLSVPANAQDTTPDRYLAVGGAVLRPDSARGDDGSGATTRYGTSLVLAYGGQVFDTRWWEARAFAAQLETKRSGANDFYQYGAGLDLLQPFGDQSRGHTFALVGGGGAYDDVIAESKDGFSGFANAGLGWRFAPMSAWPLRPRVDVRGIYSSFEGGQLDAALSFVLEILPTFSSRDGGGDREVSRERSGPQTRPMRLIEVPGQR